MAPGIYTPQAEPLLSPNAPATNHGSILQADGPALDNATLVTTDFYPLQFESAASRQLTTKLNAATNSSLLIASPYNFADQLLDLRSLDTPNRLFALALTGLTPTRPDYATAPYVDSLNWQAVLIQLRDLARAENFEWKEQSFYVVIFRSKLKEVVNRDLLHLLDQTSHVEATASGGLLKYWFGDPNSESRNLATCLWRSKEDARLGGLGPWHKKARSAARDLYDSITFSSHRFTIKDGITGWSFDQWEPKGSEVAHPHAPASAEDSCERALPASGLPL
ncbi:hypothetical protein BU16DRAFT_553167 [Lophium mytilinum]|uniref:Uncharacterized protein n=1 Tax=Lophium mytilinum TaxID=390894 RepID=A0A6A6QCP4_9PEZI|nr:hypothetical protein BU16DRAFT_553167 [Lophium mytilinum]